MLLLLCTTTKLLLNTNNCLEKHKDSPQELKESPLAHLDFSRHQAEMIHFQDRMLSALRDEMVLLRQKLCRTTHQLGKSGARNEGRKGRQVEVVAGGDVGLVAMPRPDTLVERREVVFELRDEFCPELPMAECREERVWRSQEVKKTRVQVERSLAEVRKARKEEKRRGRSQKEDSCLEVGGSDHPSSEMWVETKEVGEQLPNTSEILPTGLKDGNGKAVVTVKVKYLDNAQEIAMIDQKAIGGVEDMASLEVPVPSWREDVKHYALFGANTSNHEKSYDEAECPEATSNKTYLRRHNKHEKNEKLEKKRHKQKLRREEKELQKLVARQKLKGAAKNSDRAREQGRTLLPVPEEATHVSVEDTVPVSAFGRQLPDLEASCFSLSWM